MCVCARHPTLTVLKNIKAQRLIYNNFVSCGYINDLELFFRIHVIKVPGTHFIFVLNSTSDLCGALEWINQFWLSYLVKRPSLGGFWITTSKACHLRRTLGDVRRLPRSPAAAPGWRSASAAGPAPAPCSFPGGSSPARLPAAGLRGRQRQEVEAPRRSELGQTGGRLNGPLRTAGTNPLTHSSVFVPGSLRPTHPICPLNPPDHQTCSCPAHKPFKRMLANMKVTSKNPTTFRTKRFHTPETKKLKLPPSETASQHIWHPLTSLVHRTKQEPKRFRRTTKNPTNVTDCAPARINARAMSHIR